MGGRDAVARFFSAPKIARTRPRQILLLTYRLQGQSLYVARISAGQLRAVTTGSRGPLHHPRALTRLRLAPGIKPLQ